MIFFPSGVICLYDNMCPSGVTYIYMICFPSGVTCLHDNMCPSGVTYIYDMFPEWSDIST